MFDPGANSRRLAQWFAVCLATLGVLLWYGHATAGHLEPVRHGYVLAAFPWIDVFGWHLTAQLLAVAFATWLALGLQVERFSHLGLSVGAAGFALVAVSPFAVHYEWFAAWEALVLLPALVLPLAGDRRLLRPVMLVALAVIAAGMVVASQPAVLALALLATLAGFALHERAERLAEAAAVPGEAPAAKTAAAKPPAHVNPSASSAPQGSPATQGASLLGGALAPAAALGVAGVLLGVTFALVLPMAEWFVERMPEPQEAQASADESQGGDTRAADEREGRNDEASAQEQPERNGEADGDGPRQPGEERSAVGLEREPALRFARDMPFGDLGSRHPSFFGDEIAFTVEAYHRPEATAQEQSPPAEGRDEEESSEGQEPPAEDNTPDENDVRETDEQMPGLDGAQPEKESGWERMPARQAVDELERHYWQFDAFAHYDPEGFRWYRDPPREDTLRTDADAQGWIALPAQEDAVPAEPGRMLRIRLRPMHDRICPLPTPAAAIRAPAVFQSREGAVRFAADISKDGVQYDVLPGKALRPKTELTPKEEARYLEVPETLSERLHFQFWIGQIEERITPEMGREEIAHQVALAFDTGHYRYDLRPQLNENRDPNIELLRTRVGYCQHYASLTTMALRSLGVPARIATGFGPGYFHREHERLIVSPHRAHAWSQLWVAGRGWIDVDPLRIAHVPMATEGWDRGDVERGDRRWLREPGDIWDERFRQDPSEATERNGDGEREGGEDEERAELELDDDELRDLRRREHEANRRDDDRGELPHGNGGERVEHNGFADDDLSAPPELDPTLLEKGQQASTAASASEGGGTTGGTSGTAGETTAPKGEQPEGEGLALREHLPLVAGTALSLLALFAGITLLFVHHRRRRREKEAERAIREHLLDALGWDPDEETFEELLARLAELEPLRERVVRAFQVWEGLLAQAEHARDKCETPAGYATRMAWEVYREQEPSRSLATWAGLLERFIDRFERACYAPWPLKDSDGPRTIEELRRLHPEPQTRHTTQPGDNNAGNSQ